MFIFKKRNKQLNIEYENVETENKAASNDDQSPYTKRDYEDILNNDSAVIDESKSFDNSEQIDEAAIGIKDLN